MSSGTAHVCPKCERPVEPSALECPDCGVVFAKYLARTKRDIANGVAAEPTLTQAASGHGVEQWGQFGLLVALAVWTLSFATTPLGPGLLDTVWHLPDLVFHEAGHVLFMPFGAFVAALGGSAFQCLLPVTLAGVFWHQGNRFGAVVCLWWAGQNLVDVAPYIADARVLQLELLGGRTGGAVEGHDWEYLLTQLGWLHLDRSIGLWTYRAGLATMILSAAVGLLLVVRPRTVTRTPQS